MTNSTPAHVVVDFFRPVDAATHDNAQRSPLPDTDFLDVDEWSDGLIIVSCSILHLPDHQRKISLEEAGVARVQCSADGSLCAILFASNTFVVFEDDAPIAQHSFGPAPHRVLGIYWIETAFAALLVATTSALLFFNLDRERRSLALVRAQTRDILDIWFLPFHRLLVTVDIHNGFDIWSLKDNGPKKVSRFTIAIFSSSSPEHVSRQIRLVGLYSKPALLFVDEFAGRLHAYILDPGSLVQTNSFDLFSTGPTQLFVVDNVIVAIPHERKHLPMLFDTQAMVGSAPLVSPLPMSESVENCRVLSSDRIVVGDEVGTLSLRLDTIVESWGSADPEALILFLCRRSNAGDHIIRALRDQVKQERLSSSLARSLSTVSISYAQREATSMQQRHLVGSELHTSFVSPGKIVAMLVELMATVNLRHLEAVCVQLLQSLIDNHMSPSLELVDLMVDIFIDGSSLHQLQQFVQYHMFPDTVELAKRLCSIGRKQHRSLYQLGLDMLHRLGAHRLLLDQVCQEDSESALLPDQVVGALQMIASQPLLFEKMGEPSPRRFLGLALASGCRSNFHDVFRYFQKRNLARYGSETFRQSDGCDEYADIFRKYYLPKK